MIPQNFKDILSNGENVGLYQTLALILFVLFFIGLVYVVLKPKNTTGIEKMHHWKMVTKSIIIYIKKNDMKPRTPVFVNFVIVVALLIIVYNMFVQNTSFFGSPYFWATVIIAGIMVFIANGIGDLIENNRFQKLSEEEKKAYLEDKKTPYYKRLWASAFKSNLTLKSRI